MAACKPVVRRWESCIPEIVQDGRDRLLVPMGMRIAWQKRLSSFYLIAELAQQMGAAQDGSVLKNTHHGARRAKSMKPFTIGSGERQMNARATGPRSST
jgi:hypothetical protein